MTKQESAQENQQAEAQSVDEHQQADAEVATDESQVAQEETLTQEADERLAELELALVTAEQRADEANDRAVRAVAEMENIRRRAAQEVDKAHKFALEKFANELLTTVDNLERALQIAADAEDVNANFLEGIELTYKGLQSTLNKFGVEAVGEEGEVFNPDLHQAMSMQAVEGKDNNTILAVMQKGYTLSGRLLRPAMVMVVKN
ncbi:nucleotide exchange factor GrpE [Pseudidiomarina salilacus]|uniref:nucleotide exchange factor GrpE n=1 Tax=Pseudidiomarina salilacus TaxID=3384452 RepID=UPI003984D67E